MFSHLSQITVLFLCYFKQKFGELIHSNTKNAVVTHTDPVTVLCVLILGAANNEDKAFLLK